MDKCPNKSGHLSDIFLKMDSRGVYMQNKSLIAIALILVSTAAFADPSRYTATLAQPLTQKRELLIDGNLFRCDGSTCILTSHPENADSVQICRALRRQVGALTDYVANGTSFAADRLAKCNAST
jgi:hypothetical protein